MRCRFLETRFVGLVTSLFQDRKQQQTSEVMLNLRVLCHLLAPTTSRGVKVLMALLHVKQPTTRLVPASPSGEKCAPLLHWQLLSVVMYVVTYRSHV
jgi:hypothetical protein